MIKGLLKKGNEKLTTKFSYGILHPHLWKDKIHHLAINCYIYCCHLLQMEDLDPLFFIAGVTMTVGAKKT